MDTSLFQYTFGGVTSEPLAVGVSAAGAVTRPGPHTVRPISTKKTASDSANLDLLRSFAVLLVVGFHLAKFFDWRSATLRITDFGLLGVMFFFVHTTLVLLFSLERQSACSGASLFLPFMVRRCFRIYPLAVLMVSFVYLFRIPSDLQFGSFRLLHQSFSNVLANLLLIQNVARQTANPGVLWSLPLELQMYLALPALFLFAGRVKSAWAAIAFWWMAVALWFAIGFFSGVLPLSESGIRSPAEALLKFTRYAPCFLPGIVAYKLWRRPRFLSPWFWPVFLALCSAAFLRFSGSQPVETGWFICLTIGVGVCLFREMPENLLTRGTKRVARYSYGIYLLHYFAIWIGFVECRSVNPALQTAIFAAVLIALSVLLYHTVEAPLIKAGIRLSEKLQYRGRDAGSRVFPLQPAAPVCSEEAGSL